MQVMISSVKNSAAKLISSKPVNLAEVINVAEAQPNGSFLTVLKCFNLRGDTQASFDLACPSVTLFLSLHDVLPHFTLIRDEMKA